MIIAGITIALRENSNDYGGKWGIKHGTTEAVGNIITQIEKLYYSEIKCSDACLIKIEQKVNKIGTKNLLVCSGLF